jgi:diguanylate cyclase (GGDEF)-like protein/PAS domain S-box-containing protein
MRSTLGRASTASNGRRAVNGKSGERDTGNPEAEARFRLLFDRATVGIVRFGPDGTALEANPALEQMLGYTAQELAELSFTKFTHPDEVGISTRLHQELLGGERDSYAYEKRYIRKDGEVIWCQVSVWRDAGAADSHVGTAMLEDVTARKRAETELHDHANRLERIIATQRDIATAAGDLDHVMQVIAERSRSLTGADGSMVSMIEGDEIVTRAASGIGSPHLNNRRPITETVARYAIEARGPLLIEHAEGDPRLNQRLLSAIGDRSHICVPLFSGEDAIGALSVMSASEERRLGEDERQTLELLAGALSAGVSRAAELAAERSRLEALTRFEAIYARAPTGVMVIGPDGRVVDANPAMLQLLDGDPRAPIEEYIWQHVHPDDRNQVQAGITKLLAGDSNSLRLDHRFVAADGSVIWVCSSVSLVRELDGRASFGIAIVQDVTQRKSAEAALLRQAELNEHQALHDDLTGLPNRTLFANQIEREIAAARRSGSRLAIAVMDLDGFKEVNDSLGHDAGDVLLMQLSERLRGRLRSSDGLARLGGDEFGVLVSKPRNRHDVLPVVEKVREALEEPLIVDELPLSVEASIGVAVYPEDGEDVHTLLRRADGAMYRAKEEKAGYAFYDPSRDDTDPTRLTLVGELRRAIERRELVLFYQPKAALSTGAVDSVEALLRWQHPTRGWVAPDDFIPLAQQTGLIKPLTLYVLDQALRQCRDWQCQGLTLAVAVNLSVRNLLDVDFPEQVRELLRKWAVDPALLSLEITESTMLADPIRTARVLEKLSLMGITMSIDDFGTGYSSLAHLSKLPVDEIKIDRSFVMKMDENSDDAAIVRSTIDLARNLGLQVVAEGVETERVWNELNVLGCTLAQGYYLSRPVPPPDLVAWLRRHRDRPDAGGGPPGVQVAA